MSGQNDKLLVGFVVLHVLCCGLPLLIAAGAFTGAGTLLGSGPLVAVGVLAVAVAVAVVVAMGRAHRGADADCCPADASETFDADDARTASGQR